MNIRQLVLLAILFCCNAVWAVSQEEITQLEADMLKYLSTNDREAFTTVTNKLKAVCKETANDRLFYRAWSNQAVFEAVQQYYQRALGIADDIMHDALKNGSTYGEYMAIHTQGMVLLQKQDYTAAEMAFLKAVEFHHRHFSNESAGDDLQELMKIANHRKDPKAGERYARQIVNEPNVAPIQKGRALYRLSQMAFNKNNIEEFNRIYGEMMKLKESDGIGTVRPLIEVNHCIINGDYQEALRLTEQLNDEENAERRAVIYHRMGDDANAYKYMLLYKRISDSITLVSHGNVVASCYVQMNNERLQLEQQLLERQNNRMRNHMYFAFALLVLVIMLVIIWRIYRLVKRLKVDNKQLVYEQKDAERALTDLNELSFYESKTELPLTTPTKLNELCNRLLSSVKAYCQKGVSTVFLTELDDDYEISTDPEALRKLLKHLLDYSARYTSKGNIKLNCADSGDYIRFTVTDTSPGLGGQKNRRVGMFSDENNKIRYVGMNFNICQSITRLLHGRIWHDVEYTDGTRFCVEIPKEP